MLHSVGCGLPQKQYSRLWVSTGFALDSLGSIAWVRALGVRAPLDRVNVQKVHRFIK